MFPPGSFTNTYIEAAWTFAIYLVLGNLLFLIFKRYLLRIVRKLHDEFDELLIRKTEAPIAFLIILWGFKRALTIIQYNNQIVYTIIFSILTALLFYVISTTVNIILTAWSQQWKKKTASQIDEGIMPFLHGIVTGLCIIAAFLVILSGWNVEIGPYLASLGILGLAVSLALQNTLSNIFAGISIVLDKCFHVSDFIKLESGDKGEVIDIGLRSTKINTIQNQMLVVPNSKLAESRIINYAKPTNRLRMILPVSVAYTEDVEKVKVVLIDSLKSIKQIDWSSPPLVRFEKMGAYSLDFNVVFFIFHYKDRYDVTDVANTHIFNNLKRHHMHIPFPTSVMYMKK